MTITDPKFLETSRKLLGQMGRKLWSGPLNPRTSPGLQRILNMLTRVQEQEVSDPAEVLPVLREADELVREHGIEMSPMARADLDDILSANPVSG